jgi:colanic acid/amylovoran biosynthesis glycosyltransferase
MKIAFIVSQFPSISETFILRQITGLLERGHEVDVFAFSRGDTAHHEDVEEYKLLQRTRYIDIYASSSKPVRLLKRLGLLIANFHKHPRAVARSLNVLKFREGAIWLQVLNQIVPFLDKGPYDVVHCQFGPFGALGLLLRDTGVFRGKIVTSFRGYDISSYIRSYGDRIYDDLFRRGDLFLCVSEHIKRKLVRLGCDERKIVVHRSGVDLKEYCQPDRAAKNRDKVTILTIARLIEKKGVEYGIRGLARVRAEHPEVRYQIAGDGPLREKLENLVHELKLDDHVQFLGWKSQAEIAELLQSADILLCPSVTPQDGDEEGIPGVIMEAFAHGLPVIGTTHGGIREIVYDGVSGYLVPERRVDVLAEKLRRLIESSGLRAAMGQEGRRFVREHYDIEKLNDRLSELYQNTVDGVLTSPRMKLTISAGLA